MKRTSLILAIIMIISVFSVSVSAAGTGIFDDNFSSYAEDKIFNEENAQGRWYNSNGLAAIADAGGDYGQVLDFDAGSASGRSFNVKRLLTTAVAPDEDKHVVVLDADVRQVTVAKDDERFNILFYLGKDADNTAEVPVATFRNKKLWIGETGDGETGNIGTFNPGDWYHINVQFDIAAKEMVVTVTTADGVRVASKVVTGINVADPAYTDFYGLGMSFPKGNHAQMDNVVLTRDEEITASQELLTDNFEYTDVESMLGTALSTSKWYETKSPVKGTEPEYQGRLVSLAEVKDGFGKSMGITKEENWDNMTSRRSHAPISSGIVKYQFDIMPASGKTVILHVLANDSANSAYLLAFSGGTLSTDLLGGQSSKIGTYDVGKWYHCVVEIDLDNKIENVAVTDENGTTTVQTWVPHQENTASMIKEWKNVSGVNFQTWGAAGGTPTYIDNLVVTKEKKQSITSESTQTVPAVKSSSIKFYEGKEEVGSLSEVSAETDRISLDFGTMMNMLTLNSALTVYDDTADEAVTIEIKQQETGSSVYDVNIPAMLVGGHTYTLSVTGAAKNLSGVAISAPFTVQFTAEAGTASAGMEEIKVGRNVIDDIDDLVEGELLSTNISFKNTTGAQKKIKVLFCYYQGAEMKNIEYQTITIDATDKLGTKPVTHTIGSMTDIDRVEVMVWEDFQKLMTLPGGIELKRGI